MRWEVCSGTEVRTLQESEQVQRCPREGGGEDRWLGRAGGERRLHYPARASSSDGPGRDSGRISRTWRVMDGGNLGRGGVQGGTWALARAPVLVAEQLQQASRVVEEDGVCMTLSSFWVQACRVICRAQFLLFIFVLKEGCISVFQYVDIEHKKNRFLMFF